MESALYEDDQGKRFVGVASDLIYTGEIQRDDLYENFLVIVDKKTNKVCLFSFEHGQKKIKTFLGLFGGN